MEFRNAISSDAFQDMLSEWNILIHWLGSVATESCKSAPISFAMPACPSASACNFSRTAEQICLKFGIGEFFCYHIPVLLKKNRK
jgi:hypothetical protein